ncbi:MAG: cobalamin-dependent protein, partial [Acidimicrobiia bacterium]
ADVLRGASYEVIDFGANTPVSDITAAISESESVVAVALSANTGGRDDEVRAAIAEIRSLGLDLPILLGGSAIGSESTAVGLGANGWAPDARAAVKLVEAVRKR